MPLRFRQPLREALLRFTVILIVALLPAWLPSAARGQEAAAASVLILHSNQRATPAQVIIDEALRTTIAGEVDRPVQVFSEYLDDEWTSLEMYGVKQAEFLRAKYEARRIEVIIADALPALRFLSRFRDSIVDGAPVVYLAVADDRASALKLPPGFVGVFEDLDPTPTLQLALRLHPRTTRVVFVDAGNDPGRMWDKRMRGAVAKVGGAIEAQFLTGLSHADVLQRVRALEPGTVIYTPGYFRDGAGQVFTPRQSIEAIAAASPVPVYGAFDTQVGSGIVGGYMTSYRHEASAAGELAVRLLDGAAAADLTPSVARRLPMIDWRQVRRFDVEEHAIPSDAILQFRDATPWEKYRVQISTGVAIVVLQAALICALLLQRARRRAAEQASTALAWRLLTAHEDERRRLARDLHDDVTQRLARLAIDASKLERDAPAIGGKVAARAVREDLMRLSEDVHALSYQLHPSVLDDLGLAEGIRAECTRLTRQESLAVDVDVSQVPGNVPREPSLCLFRIAQEALRNVVRHAQAKAVSVSLIREGRGLKLTVRDNGRGFNATRQNEHASLGRISMRERARQVGGSVRVVSTPGEGTTVTAWVPIEAPA